MSDLISRSKLKKTLLEYNYTTEHNQIFRYIDEQSTAFDIEKVISKLNEKAENHGGEDYYIEIGDAIEIVKRGGVCGECIEAGNCDVREDCPNMPSDDVCEWRLVDRPYNLPIYNTSCGKIRLQYATGIDIYCNGCGKKIKIVGD